MLAHLRQSVVQFQVQLRKCAWLRTGIAPRVASAVIGADAGERRDARLHQRPVEGEIAEPVFDDDRGPATPSAVDMQFVTVQIDQISGWRGRITASKSLIELRAADSQESVLVPMTSVTRYTLSPMTAPSSRTQPDRTDAKKHMRGARTP